MARACLRDERVVELLMLIHSNDAMIEGRSQEFLEITKKEREGSYPASLRTNNTFLLGNSSYVRGFL